MEFTKIKKNIRNKLTDRKKQEKMLLFFVKFLVFALPLYAVIYFGVSSAGFQQAVADFVVWMLNASGVPAGASGIMITLEGFAGYISWDCIGWKSLVAFFALINASPLYTGHIFWGRKRYFGYLLLPVIFAVNLMRLYFMFFIASFDIELYFTLHDIIWSWGLILLILVLWMLWYKYVK